MLAATLFHGWGADPDSQILNEVVISYPGDTVRLPPAEAYGHPMLSGWSCADLSEAVGKVLQTGACRHDLSSGAPRIVGLSVSAAQRTRELVTYSSRVDFSFTTPIGPVQVEQHFGQPAGEASLSGHWVLTGDTLFVIGVRARQIAGASAPAEQPVAA